MKSFSRRSFLSLLGLAPAASMLPLALSATPEAQAPSSMLPQCKKEPVVNPAWENAEFEERFELHPMTINDWLVLEAPRITTEIRAKVLSRSHFSHG